MKPKTAKILNAILGVINAILTVTLIKGFINKLKK